MTAPAEGPSTRAAAPGWWSTLARLGASWSGRIGGAIALLLLAVATVGPTLYPVDPYRMAIGQRLRPPSAQHPLGTDEFGRDLLARVIHGSRISLRVGLISVAIGGLVGAALGLAAGLGGRATDSRDQRAGRRDAGVPRLPAGARDRRHARPEPGERDDRDRHPPRAGFVRVVRAGVLSLRTSEFVLAARALGARAAGCRRATSSATSPRP